MSEKDNGFKKLSPKEKARLQELAKTDKDVSRLLEIYEIFFTDSSKEWNTTITFIQRAISKGVIAKDLDLDDKYFKTLWEILKGGANASKTIASARADAGITEDKEQVEDHSHIQPITAETSNV